MSTCDCPCKGAGFNTAPMSPDGKLVTAALPGIQTEDKPCVYIFVHLKIALCVISRHFIAVAHHCCRWIFGLNVHWVLQICYTSDLWQIFTPTVLTKIQDRSMKFHFALYKQSSVLHLYFIQKCPVWCNTQWHFKNVTRNTIENRKCSNSGKDRFNLPWASHPRFIRKHINWVYLQIGEIIWWNLSSTPVISTLSRCLPRQLTTL